MVKLLTAAHCHPGIQILLMDQRTELLKVSNTREFEAVYKVCTDVLFQPD